VLKITLMETQTENRWILQGQLIGPWVQELRALWKKKSRTHTGQNCVLDLNDVTFIDKSGETLLRAICKKGAQLVARGVYTKDVLERCRRSAHPSRSDFGENNSQ
jgi:anti-anti-sigma regulatory factor